MCLSTTIWAQSSTNTLSNQYELAVNGDTINRTDAEGKRVGLWSIYKESRYGDDSFYEIGSYIENKKNGNWKTLAKNGLLIKETNYYNNFKHGESKFYEQGRLVCTGQFKALRTDVPYDTIMVEDPVTNELRRKIVATSLGSVRHGFWVYYKPPFKQITKIEEYQWDDLIYTQDYETKADSLAFKRRVAKYPHTSGKLPPGVWNTNKGQTPPRFTDFPENTKYVKPNPGKKKVKH